MKNINIFRICQSLYDFFTHSVSPSEFVQISLRILENEASERDREIFKEFIVQIIKSA